MPVVKPIDRSSYRTLLVDGATALGVALSDSQVQVLENYLVHLTMWNRRLNLTSIRAPDLMMRHHLLDCLSIVPMLEPTGHIMDVGSGAGLPGIVIKILLPDKKVTLLECRRKRANFLRHLIRSLKLMEAVVIEDRLEKFTCHQFEPLDETIARAFTDNDAFLRASSRLLPRGGRAILMHGPKGRIFLEERRALLDAIDIRALEPKIFNLPFGGEDRTVLFFEKI